MKNLKENIDLSGGITQKQSMVNFPKSYNPYKDTVNSNSIEESYNKMGFNSGKNNNFKSFGSSGKKLSDLEAASRRIRTPDLNSQLNQLKSNKPIMPGYMTPESARAYRSNLKSWEDKMAELQREISAV